MAKKNHCGKCQKKKTKVITTITKMDSVTGPSGLFVPLCMNPGCKAGRLNRDKVRNSVLNFGITEIDGLILVQFSKYPKTGVVRQIIASQRLVFVSHKRMEELHQAYNDLHQIITLDKSALTVSVASGSLAWCYLNAKPQKSLVDIDEAEWSPDWKFVCQKA